MSRQQGRHRYTARYDRMNTSLFSLNDRWQLAAEAIRLSGSLRQRAEIGLPAGAAERLLQLAARYSF